MLPFLLIALLVNAAYLAAFTHASLFYVANVLFHLLLGIVLAGAALLAMRAYPAEARLLLASALPGLYLAFRGNIAETRWALWLHIALAAAAAVAFCIRVFRDKKWSRYRAPLAAATVLLAVLPAGTAAYRKLWPDRIRNPQTAPASMDEEGAGPQSRFFPSSAKTASGGLIPAEFFLESETCGKCHRDIYEQWKSSMHHFASFNNQFYRKSIEFMQEKIGTKPSRWCAGCHDHALLFSGRFDTPIKEQMHTPEAQAGLACVSCHSIVHVGSSMGNGDFTIEYPPLHALATSKNRWIGALDYFVTYLNPRPHKQTFLKPAMRADPSEFCSACHKVHLDVPVNQYRWVRGFNDYDNWQASGVSGQGARSFYYPEKSSTCVDCHMPLVESRDPGNHSGRVHSHRFPAANMAVALANQDVPQMDATAKFLKSGFITVDIFAVTPVEDGFGQDARVKHQGDTAQAMSTFAVGEEAEQSGAGFIREVGRVAAPIDAAGARLQPGSTARVDVVVRTRKIGHFFPGGTVDAFDVWLEFEARDADGRAFFWSGRVEDGGKGPVEAGAHFYRSYQLDAEGNPINKRNAWQTRSVLYVRLIPPGAADVAHFRVKVPKDIRGPVTLTARLNYRKFAWHYTQFAYEGAPDVSGAVKHVPDLPVLMLAQSAIEVPTGETEWKPLVRREHRERWNDWGIGLLLQGDLKGAEYAFRKVSEADPGYADGWLNVARALIQEGETEAAAPFVERALKIDPSLARVHFFRAAIQKAAGDYDAALASLRTAAARYPRDRVVWNQIGRVLFLKRDYAGAIRALEQVGHVDPEDVQMHYTLMLCYRGLGDMEKAAREERLFRRFKADESSQSITARRRMLSPEDNNERQMIHDHGSVTLEGVK
ncbi:MAG TPA: tetratricopeptide repeat protein [Bryobacteraceae bacterium]|nr:tetratricopeptide repeat protein [Bryobacteraceae bacterium]